VRPPDPNPALRTTTKLLDALREPANEPAWEAIDARYRPVIAGLARRFGLSESDADEVAQQTLAEFVRAYREGRYDRGKGRLSSWILGIAQHTALALRRNARRHAASDSDRIEAAADPAQMDELWTRERDRAVLARAMGILRDESSVDDRTLLAFELVALRGVPAPEVASQCTMSVEQVYVAKSRLTRRLRDLVEQMTAAFEEDA
jgi:RNA polymerase sigma-70 factor, ECF subfamily